MMGTAAAQDFAASSGVLTGVHVRPSAQSVMGGTECVSAAGLCVDRIPLLYMTRSVGLSLCPLHDRRVGQHRQTDAPLNA